MRGRPWHSSTTITATRQEPARGQISSFQRLSHQNGSRSGGAPIVHTQVTFLSRPKSGWLLAPAIAFSVVLAACMLPSVGPAPPQIVLFEMSAGSFSATGSGT